MDKGPLNKVQLLLDLGVGFPFSYNEPFIGTWPICSISSTAHLLPPTGLFQRLPTGHWGFSSPRKGLRPQGSTFLSNFDSDLMEGFKKRGGVKFFWPFRPEGQRSNNGRSSQVCVCQFFLNPAESIYLGGGRPWISIFTITFFQ